MTEPNRKYLEKLAHHLASRREAILKTWRATAEADPQQTTNSSLSRGQFNDHIPQVLDAFELKLKSRPGGASAANAEEKQQREGVQHGLTRWQQGYHMHELMREWGHLHLCIYEELENFAAANPDVDRVTMAEANRELVHLVNEGISESTAQYARLQQAEAAGRVNDLQQALAHVSNLEKRRAELIHQAVHDLRGNVNSVSTVAQVLSDTGIAEEERAEFARMLAQGVEAVTTMLGDLMSLARLEAGQEHRDIESFDVSRLVMDFCTLTQPVARGRSLYLNSEGPASLTVEGDASKVRRMLQNLVLNALKYTQKGGVTVTWGEEKNSWWIKVADTGPGILAGPGAPMMVGLKEATASARVAEDKAVSEGKPGHTGLLSQPKNVAAQQLPARQEPGEGIGLSIVKRLCELLDASMELISSPQSGTTFRILLPKHYDKPENPVK